MDEDRVNRIRYNVNIQHSRAGCGSGITSPAVFSEELARPLIERPADYDVLINKLKIDTSPSPSPLLSSRSSSHSEEMEAMRQTTLSSFE